MNKTGWIVVTLFLNMALAGPLMAVQVAMPDPVLETAVEAIIGSNGIPGFVEGDDLAALTQLGFSGLEPTLFGVTNLTGLEAAAALEDLVLVNSPVADWAPIINLPSLKGLSLLDCAVSDADIATIASGTAAGQLQSLVLGTYGFTVNLNTVTQTGLETIGGGSFWNLGELGVYGLGQSYNLTAIATLPIGSWQRIGVSLALGGNTITSLNVISNFTAARDIRLFNTQISETELAAIDFSGLTNLQFIDLADNFISEITPLLNLMGNASGATIVLDRNPLSRSAVCVDVPALQLSGFTVSLEGVAPCGPEVTLDIDGLGTVSHMPGIYRYAPGTTVTFSASPGAGLGYAFTGWTWTGSQSGSSSEFSVTFELGDESDIFTLTAHFSNTVPGTRNLTVALDPASTGTGTTVWAPGVYTMIPGQVFTLESFPDSGSYFGGWTVDVSGGSTAVNYAPLMTMAMPDADTTVTAFFTDTGATLSLAVVGQGTTGPPPGTYALATTAELTVSAYPFSGWSFSHWEDTLTSAVIDTEPDLNVIMTTDVLLTAVFAQNYTLTLIREGGTDTLTSPASAESPGVTYTHFSPGAPVYITAAPRSMDWVFQGWSGDLPDGADPNATELTVIMDRNRTLTARYIPVDYVLTLSAQGEGMSTGTLDPNVGQYGYLDGESVTLNAFPPNASTMAFIGWRDNATGTFISSALSLTIQMTENRDITGVFATDSSANSLIVQTSGSGTGQTVPAPGVYQILPRQVPYLAAIPDPGMYFGGWLVEADFGGGFNELYTEIRQVFPDPVMPPYPMRLTARFEPDGHRLTILEPEGLGSVSPLVGTFDLATGTPVTLSATPEPGWNFVRWVDASNNTVATANPYSFTLTADREIRAVFERPTYTLTLIRSGAGTTSPPSSPAPGTQYVHEAGIVVFISASPGAGQVFDGWTGDVPEGIDPRQTGILVTMDRNRTIMANFAPADVTLTIQVAGTANPVNVTPPPGQYGYRIGDMVTISALPADGSPAAFIAWTGNLVSGEYILTFPITQNMTMIANYTDDPAQSQQLTVLPPEGPGSGYTFPLDTGVYRIITGSTIRFSANPDPGSYFNGWRGDLAGETSPREVSVRVDGPTTLGAAYTLTGAQLTLAVQGQGYIVPNIGTYTLAQGFQINLFAGRVNSSWVFDSWRDQTSALVSSTPEFMYTMGATDQTLTAVFVEDTAAPTIIACAPDTVAYPDENCRWFLEDYRTLITAVDDYGPISILQTPPAGTEITAPQTVTITVKDMSTASPDATCQFTVTPVPCQTPPPDYADQNGDNVIDVTELMRIIQFYNSGGYHCAADPGSTEDGFEPGQDDSAESCSPSSADLDGNFEISLDELLRVIQFYNAGAYYYCGDFSPDGDGFCAGRPATVRLAHAAPTLGFVDLCATAGGISAKQAAGLDLGDYTPFISMPAGDVMLSLVPVAEDCAGSALASVSVTLDTEPITFVSSAEPSLLGFPDDLSLPAPGQGRVRVIHANWGLQPVDVIAVDTASLQETVFAADLAYRGSSAYTELPAGNYELQYRDAETDVLLYSGLNIQVQDGGVYSVITGGAGTLNFFPMLIED